MKIDTANSAGPGNGPEIYTKDYIYYGSYQVRLKIPDVVNIQPNVGAVVGFCTYFAHESLGRSEIDFEWLIAKPEFVYIGTWTGPYALDKMKGISRIINLATGKVHSTTYRTGLSGKTSPLTGAQCLPEAIEPIENFNAASQFYTYGFDWYPNRIIWWIIHPTSGERVVLWDYTGQTPERGFTGIPKIYAKNFLNIWHTNNWTEYTNRNAIEKPLDYYGVEIEMVSYTPY